MARVTASSAGWSSGVMHGRTPPPWKVTCQSTPSGTRSASQSRNCCSSSPGSWSATSRNDTFACASVGTTVLWPGPVWPPQAPLISAVGRAHTRSSVVKPFSPYSARLPAVLNQSTESNGSLANSSRSRSVSSTTRS